MYDNYLKVLDLPEEDAVFIKDLLNLARIEGIQQGMKEARQCMAEARKSMAEAYSEA
jgi:hypothetical protein